MRILLTGGSGFIGRNILEQLGDKYAWLAPSHRELNLSDTAQVKTYLENNPVDLVIHTANVGGTRKAANQNGVAMTNLGFFYNLIAAKPWYKRLIILGSGAEFDKRRPIIQKPETALGESVPADEYGLYKYVCARFAEEVDYITSLRLFAVFGKYEDYTIRFISNAICKALFDLPITIKKNVRFDYLYIDDFIKILDRCIEAPPDDHCLNIGSGEPVDLVAIAQKILTQLGKDLPIVVKETGLANEYSPDITRLKKTYENGSVTSLDEAIVKLIAYYQTILPNINKEIFLTDI